MQDVELVIRERAYHLWQAAGSPEGNSDAFWLTAQRETLAASLGATMQVAIEGADAPSATVVKKPRKAKPAATPAKRKSRAA